MYLVRPFTAQQLPVNQIPPCSRCRVRLAGASSWIAGDADLETAAGHSPSSCTGYRDPAKSDPKPYPFLVVLLLRRGRPASPPRHSPTLLHMYRHYYTGGKVPAAVSTPSSHDLLVTQLPNLETCSTSEACVPKRRNTTQAEQLRPGPARASFPSFPQTSELHLVFWITACLIRTSPCSCKQVDE